MIGLTLMAQRRERSLVATNDIWVAPRAAEASADSWTIRVIRCSAAFFVLALLGATGTPQAQADNRRLNKSVVQSVYTIQHQHGCTNDVLVDPQLQLAAQWHTQDVLNNRSLDGDVGSDGSTASDRAHAAGFSGGVAETVAINPALAINGIEILKQWYYRPDYLAIMSNCAYSKIGVWSENSLDRSVVVAVYGQPQ